MAMNALRKGASGGLSKIILMSFMTLAVGGLVLTDVGGFFRGGITRNDVARVGNETVGIVDFDRVLRNNLAQIGLSAPEAYRLGYINQVLSAEIRTRLLSQSVSDLGVKVGTDEVAAHVRTLVEPLLQPGQSPRDVVEQTLSVRGLSESEFFDSVARDLESSLLQDALAGPLSRVPEHMALDLYRFENEARTISYISFLYKDVSVDTQPTNEDLRSLFEATKETYAIPERRDLSVLQITTDDLAKTIEIADEELQAFYDRNIDMFSRPESWTFEQTIVNDQTQATQIFEKIQNGQPLSEATETVTGNQNAFLGEQTTTQDQLLDDIYSAFALKKNVAGVLEPIRSPLGWHVAVLKDYEAENVQPFNAVKGKIYADLIDERLIDQKYDLADQADDLFASGARAQEVANTVPSKVSQVTGLTASGRGTDGEALLENFAQDVRSSILQEAFALSIKGEASPVFETQDGSMMAVILDGITPRSYPDFEDVREELREQWIRDQKFATVQQQASDAFQRLTAMDVSLEDISSELGKRIDVIEKINRQGANADTFIQPSILQLFDTKPGQSALVDIEGGVAIARVNDFSWPETDQTSDAYVAFKSNLQNSLQSEVMAAYVNVKSKEYGTLINQRLLDQVYGTQP